MSRFNSRSVATEKKTRGERSVLAERPRAQFAMAEAESLLSSGRAWVFEVMEQLWTEALEARPISDELHARSGCPAQTPSSRRCGRSRPLCRRFDGELLLVAVGAPVS